MTLSETKFLHAYNSWASNHFFNTLLQVPSEHYMQDMKSSHGALHGTLVHMVGAEKVWLERFQGAEQPFLSKNPPGSLGELKIVWEKVGYETAKWLASMTDKKLTETFTMKTSKGETFTHTFGQAFQHLVNHSSYHRGQIVTMLRQLDVKPPTTDMIRFIRETGK
jgi:uncharacterized damage-inducible protein DinB